MASLPQWAAHQAAASHRAPRPRRAWRWNERTAAAASWSSARSRSSPVRTNAKPERNDARRDRRAESADWTVPDGVSHGDVARQPAGDHVHPSHLIPPNLRRPDVPETYKKKPVALLMGYVGAGYSGNTTNASLPRGSTVDDVLEDALFGGLHPTLQLPIEVAVPAQVEPEQSNGQGRVVARHRGERQAGGGRRGVGKRPGGDTNRRGHQPTPPEPRESLRRVLDAQEFPGEEGVRSTHVRLPLTRDVPRVERERREGRSRRVAGGAGVGGRHRGGGDGAVQAGATNVRGVALLPQLHETVGVRARGGRRRARARGAGDDEDDETEGSEPMDEAEDTMGSSELDISSGDVVVRDSSPEYVGCRSRGCYWLKTRDDADLVGVKHARKVNSFIAADPAVAAGHKDAPPFVRVTVNGDSFMLYQIRKMIATAVAAALGHFPLELIPASLTRPARIATPIAPASTLYLVDAEFMSFRPRKEAKVSGPETPGDAEGHRRTSPNIAKRTVRGSQQARRARARRGGARVHRGVSEVRPRPGVGPRRGRRRVGVFVGNLRKLRINDDGFDGGRGKGTW